MFRVNCFPWSFNFRISFAWPTSLKALLLSLTFTFVPVTFQNFPFYPTQAHVERPMWSSFLFYNFLCPFFFPSGRAICPWPFKTSWFFDFPHIHMASPNLRKQYNKERYFTMIRVNYFRNSNINFHDVISNRLANI